MEVILVNSKMLCVIEPYGQVTCKEYRTLDKTLHTKPNSCDKAAALLYGYQNATARTFSLYVNGNMLP